MHRILRLRFERLRAVAACAAAALISCNVSARAADVACTGEACGALAFADAGGCIEIRNREASPVLVALMVDNRRASQIVLRPFGRERARLGERCVASEGEDAAKLSIEARAAPAPVARPVDKCTGEACADIALSSPGGCLSVRNLGNGTIAFDTPAAGGAQTLVGPYAEATVRAANGRDCVRVQASAAGAVSASFQREGQAADETLAAHCLGEACGELARRKVDGCVMFTNRAATWVRFKMSFVPGNATGITSALYEVAPGKEVMPLPGNMCLRSLAETPYVASFMPPPGSAGADD